MDNLSDLSLELDRYLPSEVSAKDMPSAEIDSRSNVINDEYYQSSCQKARNDLSKVSTELKMLEWELNQLQEEPVYDLVHQSTQTLDGFKQNIPSTQNMDQLLQDAFKSFEARLESRLCEFKVEILQMINAKKKVTFEDKCKVNIIESRIHVEEKSKAPEPPRINVQDKADKRDLKDEQVEDLIKKLQSKLQHRQNLAKRLVDHKL
jgi:hypothetical protein